MEMLFVLYDGFVEYEYTIPLLALLYHRVPCETVGLEGREVTGLVGLRAFTKKTVAEVDSKGYKGLVLPGVAREKREGLLRDERLLGLIREFDEDKKIVAGVCGGVAILGAAGVLRGKRFCSDVKEHPVFEGAIRVEGPAVRDGHVVTGLGARVFAFAAELLEAVVGREAATDYRRWAGLREER